MAAGHPGQEVGSRRRNNDEIAVARQPDVANLAFVIKVEEVGENLLVRQRRDRKRGDEMVRRLRHDDAHLMAAILEAPDELKALISRDAAAEKLLKPQGPLTGKRVLITSGPTHEPIDPVRYIANRSSGKQGHAIAAAAAAAGANVTLISGPVTVSDPHGVKIIKVENARDMLKAAESSLPADVAIFAAAVADWRVANAGGEKIKKKPGARVPDLALTENPDILSTIAHLKKNRPALVIGFAAETENVIANARSKLARKGCDWILANDVSPQTGIMGGDRNAVALVSTKGVENWPSQSKEDVARMLVARIVEELKQ
jgi:phosphopantothenoylcysteine decarboxylase/phosphopantothenate--cysteine ligase